MQKKWTAVCAAVLTIAALMTGCTSVSEEGQTPVDITAGTTAAETAAETETTEDEAAAEPAESTAETEDGGENAGTAETSAPSQETIGSTGMTAEQWVAQAQQIYETACETYYTYLCTSSGYTYDETDTLDGGYVRITSCDSIEAAEAEFYSVFTQAGHENAFDGMFQTADGKLYGRIGDRGADITYASSQVTALTGSTEDTLTFSVTDSYEDPETGETSAQENVFTLAMERGVWRVSQFTMPY